jgi:death on curing protein
MTPRFLSLAQVLQIHANQIDLYGGTHGVRDSDLLDSALAMPQAGFGDQYLHEDIFAMAAAYLFHLTSNHPFFDGNKRIGLAVASVFLDVNGIDFNADDDELYTLVLGVAEGKVNKTKVAEFFRTRAS